MGNVLIDLDQRFSKFHFTFLQLYTKREFEMAASILYQANCSLPIEARVTDMPQFKKKGNSFQNELATGTKAFEYCEEWNPIVWASIADYCTTMLNNLRD